MSTYGLEITAPDGSKTVYSTNRINRIVTTINYSYVAAGQTGAMYVSGMVNDGTWEVQLRSTVKAGMVGTPVIGNGYFYVQSTFIPTNDGIMFLPRAMYGRAYVYRK